LFGKDGQLITVRHKNIGGGDIGQGRGWLAEAFIFLLTHASLLSVHAFSGMAFCNKRGRVGMGEAAKPLPIPIPLFLPYLPRGLHSRLAFGLLIVHNYQKEAQVA
jgi:hypothetical protein